MLTEAMLVDAEAHAAETPFDLAVFSGDLATRGKSAEYELAQKLLLDPLSKRLSLEKGRIFVAPGNHDVDRDEIRQMVELGLANGLEKPVDVDRLLANEAELAEATARISGWRSIVGAAGFGGLAESHGLADISRFEIGDECVGVVVLNSAWRCAGDHDKGALLIGARHADAALRAISDCDVRIAAIHHPLSWLHSFEADELQIELESRGFIVLSGHEHSPNPSARKSPRGEALYLEAGCLYSHTQYPNAYFIIDIDAKDRKATVKVRRWSYKTRLFDAATEDVPGGEKVFDLPAGGNFTDRGHPRFSTVKRLIADAAVELRVLPDDLSEQEVAPTSIEDILVEPRFLSMPYKEAQAVATLAEGVGKHELNTDELVGEKVVVLSGGPQSGVSSGLFWLLSKTYDLDATKMPAYLRLYSSRLGTAKQPATLAKAASWFGFQKEGTADPDLLLAVDDVDPGLKKKFNRLIQFLKDDRHKFILGCSSDSVAAVLSALTDADVDYTVGYLAPFGKSQLRLLATTVSRGTDADLDQIYGLIRTQSLPQTPFTMLALITVMTGNFTDPDDLNSSSLLEAFVNLLLGSGELADAEKLGMNYRKRVALLGELARELYDQPSWSMPITEVEALFLAFFDNRALRISAGSVLSSLVARQILTSDGEQVGFRHPALLHLFLGKWMLEKEEHKAEMLADPIKHSEAIGHAAALERSDRDLLARVGEFARTAIASVAEKLPRREVDELLERFEVVDLWDGDQLDKTLASLPERRSSEELDRELDKWSDALDIGQETLERPALSTARELEKATVLLSNVLRNSDLVEDPNLKKQLFELATEGWILLIGQMTAKDHLEGPMREMMEKVLEEIIETGEGENELDDAERRELQEVLDVFILTTTMVVTAAVAQGTLGAKSLASTIEACLSDTDFTESATANWLAVWIESNIDLPEWPQRLEGLLDRLRRGTFLRNATTSIAVAGYRSTSDDGTAGKLLDVLAPRLISESDSRQRGPALASVKESLRKSRRVYQSGLSLSPSSAGSMPTLGPSLE
jgi:hypothetical protein